MDLEYGIEGTQTIMDRHNSSHEYIVFQCSVLTPSFFNLTAARGLQGSRRFQL